MEFYSGYGFIVACASPWKKSPLQSSQIRLSASLVKVKR